MLNLALTSILISPPHTLLPFVNNTSQKITHNTIHTKNKQFFKEERCEQNCQHTCVTDANG